MEDNSLGNVQDSVLTVDESDEVVQKIIIDDLSTFLSLQSWLNKEIAMR